MAKNKQHTFKEQVRNIGHTQYGDNYGEQLNALIINIDRDQLSDDLKSLFHTVKQGKTELSQHIDILKEWKEAHNTLDDLRRAFDQFHSAIGRVDRDKRIAIRQSVIELWRPYWDYDHI